VKMLTMRQKQILQYIHDEVQAKGYPPSVREIGDAVGLQSSSSVHAQLRRLEEQGYLRRDPTKPRAIELLGAEGTVAKSIRNVPIVGSVQAGEPVLAAENITDYFPIPKDFTDSESVFMLQVSGDSMINAGILDGDYVLVEQRAAARSGEIVVALVDDEEATVKRFFLEDGYVRLQPENPAMEPIETMNVAILGKVVGVFRRLH